MKDRLKKALKRAASGLMAVLLVVCLVGTPRAKAVVSEGALLGSLFGSLLVSLGYSWASDNMDVPTFGESIYKLTQEFDEAMKDTGTQLIRDLTLAGVTSTGAGKLQFGYAWVQAANSFAEWFQGKFFAGDNITAVVSSDLTVTDDSGNVYSVCTTDYVAPFNVQYFYPLSVGVPILEYGDSKTTFVFGGNTLSFEPYTSDLYWILRGSSEKLTTEWGSKYDAVSLLYSNGKIWVCLRYADGSGKYYPVCFSAPLYVADVTPVGSSLTAEKPQEVHYPVVAEDGSQVYEITVDGVTATDIEGIIQGAVDKILAGTAAIAGSVEQAGTGEEVVNPEIEPYKVSLSSVFPFCIPFDVYNMVTMLVAEPEAPNAEWTFILPWSNKEYSVGWNLSDFDGVAQVCRSMELVLFAVGLAVITHKVIKW